MRAYLVVLSVLAAASALPVKEDGVMEKFISTLRDCVETDAMLCLKEKAMKYTENLAMSKELSLLDGITFTRTGSPRSARSYDPLSEDPKAREVQVEERILDNVVDFLDNHALQLRMPKSFEDDNSVDDVEGRGKKKKKLKKLLPILALLKLKFTALIPLFLGIIAFAVFKAYLLGKVAFIAAAFSALKKLLEKKGGGGGGGGGGWSAPAQEEHGWESSGGWGRSQDAQSLAYAAHAKQA